MRTLMKHNNKKTERSSARGERDERDQAMSTPSKKVRQSGRGRLTDARADSNSPLPPLPFPLSVLQRLIRDFRKLQKDPPAGISGSPVPENIMRWNAVIFGPENSPWDGGTFKLVLEFSEQYPNKAPIVKFVSKMFHPNSKCAPSLLCSFVPLHRGAAGFDGVLHLSLVARERKLRLSWPSSLHRWLALMPCVL